MENRVRELREDNDYTQQHVADKIGITQRKYSYIETGTQPVSYTHLVNYYNKENANPHRGVYELAMRATDAHEAVSYTHLVFFCIHRFAAKILPCAAFF